MMLLCIWLVIFAAAGAAILRMIREHNRLRRNRCRQLTGMIASARQMRSIRRLNLIVAMKTMHH